MRDSRLIGTWRSDARKTIRELASRRDMRLAKNKKLASLFGNLELRFTRTHCHSRYEDRISVTKYEVVAQNEHEAVLVSVNQNGRHIFHVHFEGTDVYWIYLGSSGNREFFKRVKSKR